MIPEHVGGRRVRRAWPRGDEVVFELAGGGVLTPALRRLDGSLEIGRPGDDSELPGLRGAAVAAGGPGAVVGHRLGRRAVLHLDDRWVKVVRPSRARALARRHEAVRRHAAPTADIRLPALVRMSESSGVLAFSHVPGSPLLRLGDAGAAGWLAGTALRTWWEVAPPAELDHHGAAEEAGVLARWTAAALAHGVVDRCGDELGAAAEEASAALRSLGRRRPMRLCHRDLHDGQVLVDDTGGVGLIDLDTVAVADPALDLGNLLAHVDLAVSSGAMGAADAERLGDALREASGLQCGDDGRAVDAYRLAARVRLVAVHAFRPATRRASSRLVLPLQPSATSR